MKAADRAAICLGDRRQREVVVDVLRELLEERVALGLRGPAALAAVEHARIGGRLARLLVVVRVMELLERILGIGRLGLLLRRFVFFLLDRLLLLVVRYALRLLDRIGHALVLL